MDNSEGRIIQIFDSMIAKVLEEFPQEFSTKLENVQVLVDFWPNSEHLKKLNLQNKISLFGLYQGVPKTKRTSNYSSLPDKITIYTGPILSISKNWQEVYAKVRSTLLHEIGHHFGLSDKQIYQAMGA